MSGLIGGQKHQEVFLDVAAEERAIEKQHESDKADSSADEACTQLIHDD